MVTSPKSKDAQEDLNKRLRSLKIDRGAAPAPVAGNRTPKLLFLGIAVLLALVALGYVFLFSSATTISVAPVRVESGGASLGESVLSASGYVVAHHKIAVGAKVMGRVAWVRSWSGSKTANSERR
jgi:HlyD family secretion protein